MPSTKIINVLKDDKFEDILDLFRETPAKEVIFVLPKRSKSFTNEEHFIILENEAAKSKKKISLLCSNPDINQLATRYKFDVLLAKDSNKPLITTVNQFNTSGADETESVDDEEEIEDLKEDSELDEEDDEDKETADTDNEESETENDNDEEEELEEAEALPVMSKTRRSIEGIVRRQGGTHLPVSPKKEKSVPLSVTKKVHPRSLDEIQNVWEQMPQDNNENIWADLGLSQRSVHKPPTNRSFPKFKNLSKKFVIAFGMVSVALLAIIIFISTGSAKIEIRPQSQPLEFELKTSTSDKFSFVDQSMNKIPGQLFSVEKTVSQTFYATGERDVVQKARGKIRVYNSESSTPQVLVANTRFEKDKLIFRTLQRVSVPGTRVEGGQMVPGSIEVEVVADVAGEAYNIQPGRFTIPAFREQGNMGKFEKIHGETTEPMSGGIVGRAKVVTESDYSTAKETVESQLRKELEESLSLQAAGLRTIDNPEIKLDQLESTASIDEAVEAFTMTISGSVKTIAFKEDDLRSLVSKYIENTRDLTVLPERLELSYSFEEFSEAENTLEFTLGVKGNGYSKVDTDKVKQELVGKNEDEIKAYLRGTVGIESAKVLLSPFWVRKIPEKPDKTLINISY